MVREALTVERLKALRPGEAAAYFVARRAEGLTQSEESLFDGWLTSDEAHRRAFESADRSWEVFAGCEDDDFLAAMRRRALAKPQRAPLAWPRAAAAAAVLVLAVGAGAYLAPGLLPHPPAPRPQQAAPAPGVQYVSMRGEVKAIKLLDGSDMTLDADSAATARFDGKARTVELTRGRAFFAVVHDTSRPFTVVAMGRRVTAVGTRFDVSLAGDGLAVTLEEGRLSIAAPTAAPAVIEAGQQFTSRAGRDTVRTIGERTADATSWRTGLINFDDQPLSEAAAVMNRYSGDQIVIRDPKVASMRVTGQFRAGQAERFAQTLAELYRLRPERHGPVIELQPAS